MPSRDMTNCIYEGALIEAFQRDHDLHPSTFRAIQKVRSEITADLRAPLPAGSRVWYCAELGYCIRPFRSGYLLMCQMHGPLGFFASVAAASDAAIEVQGPSGGWVWKCKQVAA